MPWQGNGSSGGKRWCAMVCCCSCWRGSEATRNQRQRESAVETLQAAAPSTGAPLPGAKRAAVLGDERERVGRNGRRDRCGI